MSSGTLEHQQDETARRGVTPPPAPGGAALETAPSAPAPRSAGRLVGLDIARGLAVLGMMTAHVGLTSDDLSTYEGWLGFAHGRSSILFATLAGVSLGILTGGREPYTGIRGLQARTRVLARGAMLFAIGGALAVLSSSIALILAYYGVWFVLALPFVRLRARTLLITGVAVGLVGAVAHLYVADLLTRLGYSSGWDANGAVPDVLVLGVYPGIMWMGFVLVGLGLSRLDLRSTAVLVRLVIVGVLVAAAGYGGSALATRAAGVGPDGYDVVDSSSSAVDDSGSSIADDGTIYKSDGTTIFPDGVTYLPDGTMLDADGEEMTLAEQDAYWESFKEMGSDGSAATGPTFDTETPLPDATVLLSASPHSTTPFEFLGAGGVAVAVIGLCSLAPLWLRRVLLPLAAVGSMSLTAYSLHVLAVWIWPGYFFGRETNWPLLVMVGSALVLCTVWSLTLGRGPLERLVRWVSMRAASTDDAPAAPVAAGTAVAAPTRTPE